MDPSSSQANDTASDAGRDSSSPPPSFIWVMVPLVAVLVAGGLVAVLYRVITRLRRRETGGGDPEQTGGAPGPAAALEVEDATAWARGHAGRDPAALGLGPGSRGSRGSGGATQPAEGLNELGEAPPPYGEGGEGTPKGGHMVAGMVEVRDFGEGTSGAGPRQGRRPLGPAGHGLPAGPEPPAYEESAAGPGVSSVLEPAAAVISQPR